MPRVFVEVTASNVRKGDLFANHGTVTEIVRGPRIANEDRPDAFENLKRGEVLVRCGPSFASKGVTSRKIVVGRIL